jgi:capsular polysaccharide biosynthesis protein
MDELKQQETVVEEGITLSDLLRIVWNNITIVFLVTLWATVIGIVITWFVIDPEYTAETGIMIEVNPEDMTGNVNDNNAVTLAQSLIVTYKEFVLDDLVLQSVINEIPALAGMSPATLRESITLTSVTSSVVVSIEVVNDDPALAALIADTLVANSIEIAENYIFLKDRIKQLLTATQGMPETPTPTSPNKILNVVISFLIGGILSLGIIFVKELFNNKFQSPIEMEKYLNINVIAAVPGTIKERKLVD